jgi:16S rRNA (adenine1518-N6/adenine1519-N6)-dimethyltransferase
MSKFAQGTVPKKRFGQHFLRDQSILDGIEHLIFAGKPLAPDHTLIEIGPGPGALTERLINNCDRLIAIELDRDLAPKLKARFGTRIEVIQSDVLRVDFAQFGSKLRIVGNLPYNISTPILFHLLPHAERVVDQVFMLQKEVVERMVASAGSAYGRLSVTLQWRYAMTNALHVPPSAFDPPPRVDSAIVTMQPRAEPAPLNYKTLEALTAAAFGQRRKILRHPLGNWLAQHDLTAEGFDMQRRAEEVPVAEYIALAQKLGTF